MKRQLQLVSRVLVLVLLNLFLSVTYASASDELSAELNAMQSMQSHFVQTTYDNQGKVAQRSQGKLAFARPGRFRWETTQPMPQLIIANGKRLWVVDPDLMQVTVRKVKQEIGETPTMLLSENVIQLEKRFLVTATHQAQQSLYTLKPKKTDSTFTVIKLQFNHQRLRAMILEDQLGHVTKIDFSNVAVNPALSPRLFQYVPPAGMDVIQED